MTEETVIIVDHPVAQDALRRLRDNRTSGVAFRQASDRAAIHLAQAISQHVTTQEVVVETQLGPAQAVDVAQSIVLVPILRAGLAMQDPFWQQLPHARVHHIGIERDESTAESLPRPYYPRGPHRRISPDDWVLLLDPMCATGGSAIDAIEQLMQAGAQRITFANIIASEAGIDAVSRTYPDVRIYTLAEDPDLNAQNYIVPGLGDYGDRYFGTE